MAATSNTDTELLTEHFGYPPVSLLDDIINSINILAERALNGVEQALLGQPPASLGFRPPPKSRSKDKTPPSSSPEEAHRHEVENGTHQLETLLCASIDRNFDKFELYVMRNILCVRPEDRDWIRLSHYEGLDFSSSSSSPDGKSDSDKPTTQSVRALRRRLQASQHLGCLLHAERARNEALLAQLRSLVGQPASSRAADADIKMEDLDTTTTTPSSQAQAPLAFLHDSRALMMAVGDAETPLSTTAAFALSQLQALRALSASLRGMAPDLDDSPSTSKDNTIDDDEVGGGPNKKKKTWRRERLEYIEGAARRHLEGARGLELGRRGEVRDGEWQGEGRRLGAGEVDALEGVVSLLGGADANAGEAGGAKEGEGGGKGAAGSGGDRMDES